MAATILGGLTVVETGAGSIAGSLTGMMLADCGARVLKVEPPAGDRLRAAMPSGSLVWNRGKESVVADLRTSGGQQQVQDLARSADVFIDAFGAGRANAWAIGDVALRAANPGLVYCSVKGFGSAGGYAHLKAYEGIVAAKAGVYSLGDWSYRSGPLFTGAPYASVGAAHFAVSATVAALFVRERTGTGQRVEATMVQGLTPMNYYGLMLWQLKARPELLDAVKHERVRREGGIVASRNMVMPCTADGRWLQITVMLPHQAQALVRATGLDHTLADPLFKDAPYFGSAEDAEAWETMMWEAFRGAPWDDWQARLLAEDDISFELLGTAEDGLRHPQIVHNGEVVDVADPDIGTIREVGPVARFARTPAVIARSAPRLDEHGELPGPRAVSVRRGSVPRHPLDGVTIIEFGYFYAMPFGVTLAASLGARVIKLEDRDGDPMRSGFGPPEVTGCKPMEGKESLSIDLRTPKGQGIVQELVGRADAFVTGFRPGIAERLHVDYGTLSAINPRLVYFDAPGYGTSGSYAARPIFASEASAVAGSYHRHAGYWLDPARTEGMTAQELQLVIAPRLRGQTPGDAYAAIALCTGLVLALLHQRRTGEGQLVSRTMIGSNAFGFADDFNEYPGKPPVALPDPENLGFGSLYRLYRAASGWIFLAITTQHEFDAFSDAIRDDALSDARFAAPDARRANEAELAKVLTEIFACRNARDWESLLTPRGVACVEVFEASDGAGAASMVGMAEFTYTDSVMRETGLVTDVDHPIFGRLVRHGLPATFSETPGRVAPGCRVGQHSRDILAELGYSPDDIVKLEDDEIVFAPSSAH